MKTVEKAYVLFALLCMARGIIPVIAAQGDESQSPQFSATSFLLQISVFAILAVLIFVHWKSFASGIRASGLLLVLCALAIASAGWSSEYFFSFRRAIILLLSTMLGIYMASRFDWEEQLNLFGWLAVISIVGSFVMVIFFPQYGISHDVHSGDWKGLFPHKNALGLQMAFGIVALAVARPKGVPRGILGASLLGAVLLLLLSRSATSVSIVAVITAVYVTLHLTRLKRRKTLPLWLVLAPLILVGVAFVAINLSVFLAILGREATLSGRTAIWSAVLDAIRERPWLGHGYAVFWRGGLQGDARDVLTAIHWSGLQQAQSGYLDLCLDLGLVGLLIFLGGFSIAVWRGLKLFRSGSTRAAKWPLVFLVFFLAYNFVESSLLQLYTFLWVPYVSIFVSLALMQTAEQAEFEFEQQGSTEMIALPGSSGSSGVWRQA
jgi:exopolysaccharide production protein ExoQ